jgi:ribosomal protein S17E
MTTQDSQSELDDKFIEELVSRHTVTVDRELKRNKTISEAYAEANREARNTLNAYVTTRVKEAERAIDEVLDKYYVWGNPDGSFSADPSGNQLIDEIRTKIQSLTTTTNRKEE